MTRTLAIVAGTCAALAWAASAGAQLVGTIVSTDPTANTVVVKSADGRETIYRTVETTRIQQNGSVVQLQSLQPGTQVQIVTDPAPAPPPTTTGTVVYPVVSGIVVAPTDSPKKSSARSKDKDVDRDVDIDIEEHEEDD